MQSGYRGVSSDRGSGRPRRACGNMGCTRAGLVAEDLVELAARSSALERGWSPETSSSLPQDRPKIVCTRAGLIPGDARRACELWCALERGIPEIKDFNLARDLLTAPKHAS